MSFLARFGGKCARCTHPIIAEESFLSWTEEGVIHLECLSKPFVEAKSGTLCGTCFIETPVSGICEDCT